MLPLCPRLACCIILLCTFNNIIAINLLFMKCFCSRIKDQRNEASVWGRGLMAVSSWCGCVSDGRVPEHRGVSGGRGSGRGRVGRRLFPPPAGQDGHTVLFTQVLLGPLPSFDLSAQNAFLLHRLHHGGVSAQPRHLEGSASISACTSTWTRYGWRLFHRRGRRVPACC